MDDFLSVCRISPNDAAKVTEASRNLADSLRTSERRDQLSSVDEILAALNLQFKLASAIDDDLSQLDRQTQLFRVIANICLDSDTNRQKLLDAEVDISALVVLKSLTPQQISSKPHAFMLRAAFGTLLNLSQDYSPSQERLNNHETLSIVFKFLNRQNINANDPATAVIQSYIYEWGWRIVNNLLSAENAKVEPGITEVDALYSWVEAFYSQSIANAYVGLNSEDELQGVYEEDLSSLESATMLLETFAFDSETARLSLAKEEKLDTLLSFAETRELPRAFAACADQSSIEEWSKIYEECKAAVGKCVVGIASEDKLMNSLFDQGRAPFVQRMLEWLNSDMQRLNISGTLAIGNLARSEENTVTVVKEFSIIPRLIKLLEVDDVKVSHASMSLLKNLSLPASNKEEIGKSGAVEVAQKFLSPSFSHVQPLQFATVGFYKHLCTQQLQNTLTIVNHGPSILDSVLGVISKSDDAGIKSEGTRILVHGIKSCWMSIDENAQIARSKFTSHAVVKALVDLLCSNRKYQILTNEAIMALTLLASEHEGANHILTETAKLTPAIKQLLQDEKEVNKKVKLNICVLYSNLLLKQTEQNSNVEQLKSSLEQDIKSLCEDSDKELSNTASTVLAATSSN